MKMTRTALAILAVFLLASCSGKEEGQKSSTEIMKDYTKTITAAPDKARGAEEASERHGDEMEKAIKELER